MTQRLGPIGIPSSVGAHWPGQEKAPRALRETGLVEYVEERGLRVTDRGDLPRGRFRPDPERRHPQNLAAVVDVARSVADRVEVTLRAGAGESWTPSPGKRRQRDQTTRPIESEAN